MEYNINPRLRQVASHPQVVAGTDALKENIKPGSFWEEHAARLSALYIAAYDDPNLIVGFIRPVGAHSVQWYSFDKPVSVKTSRTTAPKSMGSNVTTPSAALWCLNTVRVTQLSSAKKVKRLTGQEGLLIKTEPSNEPLEEGTTGETNGTD
jgi:hypothetical protein